MTRVKHLPKNELQAKKTSVQAPVFPFSLQELSPCQVTEVRVYGAADNLAAKTAELLCPVAESHDLSGTHKCEVQGVEEEHHILP